MPTADTATLISTTAPMPRKRLRGIVRPGSRTSAAKLVTVSRPV